MCAAYQPGQFASRWLCQESPDHWHFFRHFLRDARPAYTPEEIDRYVEAWSQPGAATGMINYYRSSVRTSPKRAEARFARSRRRPWSSGGSGIATSAKN
jgi:hypothetical protein